ncbi:MAG: hypothetical protein ACYC9Q_15120 [Bacillota bacterium]
MGEAEPVKTTVRLPAGGVPERFRTSPAAYLRSLVEADRAGLTVFQQQLLSGVSELLEEVRSLRRQLGQVNVARGSSPELAQAVVASGEAQGAATETEDEKMMIDLLFMGMKSMGVFDESGKRNQPSNRIPGTTVQRTGGASMLLKK